MAELNSIRETVRDRYAAAAKAAADSAATARERGCCTSDRTLLSPADERGSFGAPLYDGADHAGVPQAALNASLGCGVPTAVADLHPGETVLDLGSGAGADVLISARRVGPTGRAIGLDMTDEMLELARRNASDAGAENVEFLLVVAIVIIGIWIFGGEMSALAFSEAEVSMLLTAPVPRRGLILYKLAQSQILILINVVIWTFILRRGSSTLPGPLAAASVWVMLTTLNLHRMGEALTRASNVEYRAAGKQKKRIAGIFFAVLFTAIVAMLVLEPLAALGSPDAKNPFAFLKSILESRKNLRDRFNFEATDLNSQ